MSRKEESKGKKSAGGIIFIVIIILIIIALGVFFGIKVMNGQNGENSGKEASNGKKTSQSTPVPENPIKIFNGDARPIAVMLDNNMNAWPHASINEAYAVYEIIVEGNETRLMALFKGKDLDQVGPIRSSRHYFLDYAMENDAIYTHFGWSPQAERDINKYSVNNINGIYYDSGRERDDSSTFWRSSAKSAPHNAYVSTAGILEIANDLGYETKSTESSVLNYVKDEVDLADGQVATNVTIPYASTNVVNYEYDAEKKVYTRYSKGEVQTDMLTGENVTTKNIIITFAENYTLDDGEDKGRQEVENVGDLDGYYITNGKAIKITCSKSSRESKTKYLDATGKEIKVNDGNTYFNICPIDSEVTFE